MEPTVFCIIVPLTLNICSAPVNFDPFVHLRHQRSITLNTGNASDAAVEGKIVNTAQTDKQLIINIETKVLPQFNVYLDSLQQSPRMQCTTNEELGDGKTKKRVFTCIPISNLCCPSTPTCNCTEHNQPVTSVPPTLPAPTNCPKLCRQCMTTAIVPTLPAPPDCPKLCRQCMTTAIAPTLPAPPDCPKLCRQCMTTAIAPTLPAPPDCPKLCRQCMTTAIVPTLPAPTDCPKLCRQCMTTAIAPTHPAPPDCPKLCRQCMTTAIAPTFLVPTTSAPEPNYCPELCKQCYKIEPDPKPTDLIPHSSQCRELCANCRPPEPTMSPLDKCLSNCRESCEKPETKPEPKDTKCISCDILCPMCRRAKIPRRQKRGIDQESAKHRPLIFYTEEMRPEDYLYRKNTGDCISTAPSKLIPGSLECLDLCRKCESSRVKKPCPPAIPKSPAICKNLCERCVQIKQTKNPQCQYLCKTCTFTPTPVNPYVPESSECVKICKRCKSKPVQPTQRGHQIIPGSLECFNACRQCEATKPIPTIPKPIPTIPEPISTISKPIPTIPKLTQQCVPGSSECVKLCRICKDRPVLPQEPKDCKSLCLRCNAVPDDQEPKPQPNSRKCIDLCKKCESVKTKKIKISKRNCTHDFTP